VPKKSKPTKQRAAYKSPPPTPETNGLHGTLIPASHFTLREDGTIAPAPHPDPLPQGEGTARSPLTKIRRQSIRQPADDNSPSPGGEGRDEGEHGGSPQGLPKLVFSSDSPFIRLYHGNCLELLDAIYARHGNAGRFDAIFADPPYFLSNGGITCHAGKMVRVDKGDWDVSRGLELNHEFNLEWLRRCQRVLKPNGTLWVKQVITRQPPYGLNLFGGRDQISA
jgi:hypothetical protein